MVRTQIQLTEEQARALKEIAERENVSVAEIIRRSVDTALNSSAGCTQAERWRRAVAAAGRFHSDKTDVSINHDEYLAEAYES
jgi:predicted DNA-binding ribbon-helix-helix protein